MSSEFSGGYGSIRGQSGGNQDDRGSSGGYQSEGNCFCLLKFVQLLKTLFTHTCLICLDIFLI